MNLIARLKARGDALSRHRGLRRHGGAADCECGSVEAELHSAGAARAGEEPHSARADGAARRADAVCGGLRDSRQSLPAAVPALPRPDCGARRRDADRVARARRALRGEAGHAGRDGRGPDRRSRSDQGGARGRGPFERADHALRIAAARQPRALRHQRAARPGGKDPGGAVQHHAGRRRTD